MRNLGAARRGLEYRQGEKGAAEWVKSSSESLSGPGMKWGRARRQNALEREIRAVESAP